MQYPDDYHPSLTASSMSTGEYLQFRRKVEASMEYSRQTPEQRRRKLEEFVEAWMEEIPEVFVDSCATED